MQFLKVTLPLLAIGASLLTNGQTLPTGIVMKDIAGGEFVMGDNNLTGSPDQKAAAPEHNVTVSSFALSEAEISNGQYVSFLNSALADGLIEVEVFAGNGPDNGKQLVVGTASSSYAGKYLYTLDGTRVMKDHTNADGDNNPFTGVIQPENPINASYIGYNGTDFYIKNPNDTADFHWYNMCTYQNYGTSQGTFDPTVLNDFADWSGAGQNYSDELEGWTESNPSAATKLQNQAAITDWPATFIRWWGAQAFALYYNMSLPTEAQWEFAAKAGQNFKFAVYDGSSIADANWNADVLPVALHHVRTVKSGTANPFGIYNLAGNVWEWMADNYVAPYSTDDVTDPLIEVSGSDRRSWRGGSWNYHEQTLQSGIRFSDLENRGNDHFGFRIAGENSGIGIRDIEKTGLFFPNPSNGQIHLKSSRMEDFFLYTLGGALIKEGNSDGSGFIDLGALPAGVYYIKTDSSIQKLVIQ
ncbi:MAG: sulfatase activating formylglycine-generating enzyme [Luteibaculaceae bacterium]|jgi:formylglycine-generating enzyme required for sulfatase activity